MKQSSNARILERRIAESLTRQSWRGPDTIGTLLLENGRTFIGHNRLSIVDPIPRSDQPMKSSDGRYAITFGGEIYNYKEIRRKLSLRCVTESDTEVVLEGYARLGPAIVSGLDGMFAFVIFDVETGEWFAARDRFGIKPLFFRKTDDGVAFGSEAANLATLFDLPADPLSVEEWRQVRAPTPGYSFFRGVEEFPPGTWWHSSESRPTRYWINKPEEAPFEQYEFESFLRAAVVKHEAGEAPVTCLLSGGLDSAVLLALSDKADRAYSVGLVNDNEFAAAAETAVALSRSLIPVVVTPQELVATWKELARTRGEPLSLPNEGLIYLACKAMQPEEKVVLTGEGADELLFGYDRLFRWGASGTWFGARDFLQRYGYSAGTAELPRLLDYVEDLKRDRSLVEFLEDFFLEFHLRCLLRRMDFASMAASREARVPFVDGALVSYLYRRPAAVRLSQTHSKLPLRMLAGQFNLNGVLEREKIGFKASLNPAIGRQEEYSLFQGIVLEALGWS